jgi:lipoate-protein ligase A
VPDTVLDAVIAPSLDPWDLAGLELYWLDNVARRHIAPVLLIYTLAGRFISMGRYHLYDGASARGGVTPMRRLTGGRVVGAGDGWAGVAIIAPDRTALLPERDANLRPEQTINRYARGMLAALRALGCECFYPGRDAITFDKRELAMCSLETDAAGAMLFETALAVKRGMPDVVRDLERLDPAGTLSCPMYAADTAVTLAQAAARDIAFDDLAGAIARGYGESLGPVRMRPLEAGELAEASRRGRALRDAGFLRRDAREIGPTRSARMAAQLGAIEAHVSLSAAGTIERACLSGDFIANSPAIAALECELRGQPLVPDAVSQAVARTFGDGRNFILGIGELGNLTRLLAAAQPKENR